MLILFFLPIRSNPSAAQPGVLVQTQAYCTCRELKFHRPNSLCVTIERANLGPIFRSRKKQGQFQASRAHNTCPQGANQIRFAKLRLSSGACVSAPSVVLFLFLFLNTGSPLPAHAEGSADAAFSRRMTVCKPATGSKSE